MTENGYFQRAMEDHIRRIDQVDRDQWEVIRDNDKASVERDSAIEKRIDVNERTIRDTRWMLILYATAGGLAGNILGSLGIDLFRSMIK